MNLYTYYTNPSELFGFDDKLKMPEFAYKYAIENRIKDKRLESSIAKDSKYAYTYAHNIIKGRWPEAESVIMKDPKWAYIYAHNFIQGRWSDAEPYIMKDPEWAYRYAYAIIRGRWPEAEHYIKQDSEVWKDYSGHFGIEE